MTKVVTSYNVDLRPATSPGFAQDDGHMMLYMDSKCNQRMFSDMRWFRFCVAPEPDAVFKTAEKGVPPISLRGKSHAIVVVAGGAVIEFTNALLVPDLDVNLASVEQAMVQNKVKTRFGEHLDMLFHKHNKSIPLVTGCGLHMRPLNLAESEYICKEHEGVTPDQCHSHARQGCWSTVCQALRGGHSLAVGARLPDASAERMRHLPDVTADTRATLAHAQPHHLADDATLAANAPCIHAPPRESTAMKRCGQLACADLSIGPFKPPKFTGNRYGAPFLDMHQGTSDVGFIASKD
eukprot:6190878-Pleurochrysis_carterae.AAC.1